VIVNSHATARDLVTYAGVSEEYSSVVYPGVDPVFMAATPQRPLEVGDAPYVIAVGTTTERKNLGLAIRALRFGDGSLADLQLVIVGASADDEESIREISVAEGVADRVHRLGYLSDLDLANCMAAAECLVFPSRFEGFGLPIIEAMSAGVPVISSADPSLDEACGDAALRVNPDDPLCLASTLGEIVLSGRRKEVSDAGREHAGRFSRAATGEAVAKAVECAVGATR
jgi:glycosyltransferase involved in cell wall biosynthesis